MGGWVEAAAGVPSTRAVVTTAGARAPPVWRTTVFSVDAWARSRRARVASEATVVGMKTPPMATPSRNI